MSRRAAALAVVLSSSLVAVFAAAEPSPKYSTLPLAHLTPPPEKSSLPAHVNGHPRIDAFFVAAPSKEEARQMAQSGYHQVQVFTNERLAKAASVGRFTGVEDEQLPDACLLTHESFGFEGWTPVFQSQASVSVSRPNAEMRRQGATVQGGVDAVRLEKLVRAGGKATLIGTTMIVDPDTLGVKVLDTSKMELALVATGPAGVEVYAARDEGLVHFVVTPPKAPEKMPAGAASFVRANTRRMSAQLPETFRNGHSDCGHFRAAMVVEKGAGQMVTVQATTLTQSDDPESATPEDGSSPQLQAIRTMKKRSLLIHLSVSQSSSDLEPVLSVAFAWSGKESDQPF